MADARYDRLSAQDTTFLAMEGPNTQMHVAGLLIFESDPLANEDGGVDFESIRKATGALLHEVPRYRQKLLWVPFIEQPVWVDDPDFHLDYHVRHTSLPRPGSAAQLKRMAARIMSQSLDRNRPLWEMWVIEGLEGGRFATLSKIHHCMIDGVAGVDLAMILLSTRPEREIAEPPPFVPRPAPTRRELLRDELIHRATLPLRSLGDLRGLRREPAALRRELGARARALAELIGWAIRPPSATPINGPLGPQRRFDWLDLPLAPVKEMRRAVGCSVNDVVLTLVTGALRRYLQRRNVDPGSLDFRVSAPVSVRRDTERGRLGNRVSSWIVRLPLDEADPLAQLSAIHQTTRELKRSNQALGVEVMMQVAEWTPPVLLSLGAQAASGPINSIVTNVPGPQFPLYLLGARLLEMVPVVPLLDRIGLGVALFSYDGHLFWGFNADAALVPDLELIAQGIRAGFVELAHLLEVEVEVAL
ncbi:MAG: wax ester/triacylglycerol synthase family O-acyltransferase [Myxococcota bacterium]